MLGSFGSGWKNENVIEVGFLEKYVKDTSKFEGLKLLEKYNQL